MAGVTTVYWFRKALRLHDSPSLAAACAHGKSAGSCLLPIFILDPWFIKSGRVGDNRMLFLLETLSDLDASLRKLGSRLVVLQGSPSTVLEGLFVAHKVDALFYERDTEPYAKERDRQMNQICQAAGVEVRTRYGHTLYNPTDVLQVARNNVPTTYQSFLKLLAQLGNPDPPLPSPQTGEVPPLPLGFEVDSHHVPSMEELGLVTPEERTPFKGGETVGLQRMAKHLEKKAYIANFEKPKTDPTAFAEPSTTVLSPYLKFGCLSPRLFYMRLQEVLRAFPKHSGPPVSLLGQLYWREFFYQVGNATPNFDKMEGNKICRQIPWRDDPELLAAWGEGQTGYPFVDAAMIQLKKWGWMHHLARHVVACFLTRGDLWQSWIKGVEHFDKYLLDADWSLNNGNWMWLSASAFFHQYHRVYSPISFAKKYDKEGKYIKQFIPALKNMPAKYIYEPWTAPLSVQQSAKCIIGKDYPKPIVNHDTARKQNLDRMSLAFAANKQLAQGGDDDEVKGPPAKKIKK